VADDTKPGRSAITHQAAPAMVLRMWGSPPGRAGHPPTIDAHPMQKRPNGSLRSPRWDPGQPAGPGSLRHLVLTADAAPDGTLTSWRAEYRPQEAIGQARATAMHRALARIRTSLDSAAASDGPPADFPEYLARAALALGITDPAPFGVYVPGLLLGVPRWRYLGAAELRAWLPSQARRVSSPDRDIG